MQKLSTMEEINRNLRDEEIILWKHVKKRNLMKRIYAGIALNILMLIIINIGAVMSTTGESPFEFIIYGIFTVLNCLFGSVLILGIAFFYRATKRLGYFREDLRKYEAYIILTNKRWIQRDFRYFYRSSIPRMRPETLEYHRDIIFLNLNAIKKVKTYKHKKKYTISFIVKEKEKEYPLILEFYLNYQEFDEFWTNITQAMSLLYDPQDDLPKRDGSYYQNRNWHV